MNTAKPPEISRREFLVRTGKAAGLTAVIAGAGIALYERERHPFAQVNDKPLVRDLRIPGVDAKLIVVHGSDPAAMTRAAISNLGGMPLFVKRGDVVVVKPNIGWDRMPEQAADTNPEVVRVIVAECVAAGASRVVVTDVSCNETERCFQRSGIALAAEQAGAVVERPQESRYREVNMGGKSLGRQLVYETYLDADKFINVPIAKHHSLTGATLAMKNLYGLLGGNRSRLHQDIHNGLADLGNFMRPTLTILDAFRVLRRNGPQGGNLSDVEQYNLLVASTDPVAVDAYASRNIFALGEDQQLFLTLSEQYGLGRAGAGDIPLVELSV
jgi:uncharacterized protein (DUF362 family)